MSASFRLVEEQKLVRLEGLDLLAPLIKIATDAVEGFDAHVEEQTDEFDANAADQTTAFDTNAATASGLINGMLAETETARDQAVATASKITQLPNASPGDMPTVDQAGNKGPTLVTEQGPTIAAIDASLSTLLSATKVTQLPNADPGDIPTVDQAGNIGPTIVTAEGTTIAGINETLAGILGDVFDAVAPWGDVMQFVSNGQSLDIGTSAGSVLTGSPVAGGLRFSVGVRPMDSGSEDPANWGSAFASLIETVSVLPDNSYRETHMSGVVQRINERLTADYGATLATINQSVHVAACGQGGQTLATLSASPYLDRMLNCYTKAQEICAATGKTYNPIANLWVQGEANQGSTASAYYSGVMALHAVAEAHANTKRGSDRPLIFCSYQTSSYPNGGWVAPQMAEAYLWFQERNDYGLMSSPIYHLPYADGLHLLAAGYKRMGGHMGDSIYDMLWGRYKRPVLRPTIERHGARTLVLRYSLRPGTHLVYDNSVTSAAETGTGYGPVTLAQKGIRIMLKTDLAETPTTEITGTVDIVGRDAIQFKATADIPADGTYEVRTAWWGSADRNYTEIRDNAGDVLPTFDPAGLNVKLHNWLPISRVSIDV